MREEIQRKVRLGMVITWAAFMVLAAITVVVLSIGRANATPAGAHPVVSDCHPGWYVNPDELALLPEQKQGGLLFDGPSLVHHSADINLVDLLGGSFQHEVWAGVAPLFKVETSPYSTLNYVGSGKWWSSRIAPGDQGGMNNPVTPAVMATLPIIDKPWDDATSYSADTKVISFGVGYGNDTGNKALVSSITFQGEPHDLTCTPPTQQPTTAPPTGEPTTAAPTTPPATGEPTTVPPATLAPSSTVPPAVGGAGLPVTGVKLWQILAAAAILVTGGVGVRWLFRPKRVRTTI